MSERHLTPEFYTILNDCLDAVLDGSRSVDDCLAAYPEYADLLTLDLRAAALTARLKSPQMRESSVDALEARLRAQMQAAGLTQPSRSKVIPFRPPLGLSRTAAALIVAFIILFGSGGGVIAASSDSLPGEPLYGVKRIWESVIVALASLTGWFDDVWLQVAETRLNEALEMSARGQLTADMLRDVERATAAAANHLRLQNNPQFILYLERTYAALAEDQLVVPDESVHESLLITIAPLLTLPDRDPTPEASAPVEASPTPTLTVDLLSVEVEATATLTATVTLTSTPQPTATSRIPPTPTRTFTPTVTSTPAPLEIVPSATRTPLPPPTSIPTLLQVTPQTQPTQPPSSGPGFILPSPTWYPWTRATQDAISATRTAEAGGG